MCYNIKIDYIKNLEVITLKPNEEIHKVMNSTPARFVGGYMSEDTAVQ
ncbi:hypothetical protein ICA_05001 [Bacillus cereus BAG1O-3]|nr:hypothetical protein ICA_05001 [Bacillus cereus BAG1O-3]PFG78865.1 hypothetical protein DL97_2533 [Bacillus sp. YF23]